MATWVRQGTGTAPSNTDSDLVGEYQLDNATAPVDFDPAAVNSVRVEWTVTGSGFNDDSWTNDSCALVTSGGTEISQHPSAGGSNLQNTSEASDHTDSTGIPTGLTVAEWEGARVRGDGNNIPNEWVDWNKVMGPDGSTLAVSALTVTIDYTPAAAEGTLNQANFRIRSGDTDSLNGTTDWAAALNTDASIDLETRFRIRFEIEASGGSVSDAYKLQYNYNSGLWIDVPTTPLDWTARESTARFEAVDSKQYAAGDPTTDVLASGLGTFVAGEGVEETNLSGSVSLADGEHTELEFCVLLHRFGDGPLQLNDGDTVDFRVVRDDGTVFDSYTNTPRVTVNYPAGLIGGVFAENPGNRIGPFEDANGNKYALVEPTENDPTVMMMKSTDGGDTWAEVDSAGRPTQDELEGVEVIQDNDRLLFLQHANVIRLHIFNMSDHTTPDVWATTDEVVDSNILDAPDQQISGAVLSDGSVVAVYTGDTADPWANADVWANIRDSGGTWGTPFQVWDLSSNDNWGVIGVLGESDNFYVFSCANDTGSLYGKRITSAGALQDLFGTSVAASATGTVVHNNVGTGNEDRQNHVTPIYWNDGTDDKIWIAYKDDTSIDLHSRVITVGSGGSVGSQSGAINDDGDIAADSSSRQPMACAVRTSDGDIHVFFAKESVDGAETDLSYDVSSDDGATWGTDETVTLRSPLSRINWIQARILPSGDVGLFYDNASGVEQNNDATGGTNTSGQAGLATGFVWYDEYALSTGNAYSETLSTSITSSTAAGDSLNAADALSTSITSTDSQADALATSETLATSITSTTTQTDTFSSGGTAYSDTLSTTITSTTTSGDVLGAAEAASTAITSTTTQTDALGAAEALSTTITSTTTQTDTLSSGISLPAPWTWVGYSATKMTDGGDPDITIAKPDGVTEGTLMVAYIHHEGHASGGVTWTPPSGWTQLGTTRNASGESHSVSYYKVAGASEPADYTWSETDVNKKHGVIVAADGVDETTPLDVWDEVSDAGAGGPTFSVTTTVDDALLVAAAGLEAHAGVWNSAEMDTAYTDYIDDNDSFLSIGAFLEVFAAAGSVSRTLTHDDDENNSSGVMGAFAPASTGNAYSETLSTTITSTVSGADTANFADAVATNISSTTTLADGFSASETLSTTVTATTSQTDALGTTEALATSIVATTSVTDAAGYADSLATSITSTTSVGSTLTAVDALSTTITATTTQADNLAGATLEELTTSITATTTLTDALSTSESLATTATATTTLDDGLGVTEALATSITATTSTADTAALTESLMVSIVATSTQTDDLTTAAGAESLATEIVSTTTLADTLAAVEALATEIVATTTVYDRYPWTGVDGVTTDRGLIGSTTDRGRRGSTTDRGFRGSTTDRGSKGYTD